MRKNKSVDPQLYRYFEIYQKRGKSSIKRYVCFEVVGKKKFCVQSCDYIHLPIDDLQLRRLETQKYELFIEDLPDHRSKSFSTIKEAISKFDQSFQ